MLSQLKAMPTYVKVALGVMLVLLVYASGRPRPSPGPTSDNSLSGLFGLDRDSDKPRSGHAALDENSKSQLIAKYEAQAAQIYAATVKCHDESVAASQQAAMNGMMPGESPCTQNYPQWVAQTALLQTYIARLKSGNMSITVCEANGNMRGCQGLEASAPPSSVGEGETASNGDRETEATDRWDRGAIRGTSIYLDRYGEKHELRTAPYYFEDTVHGTYVPSDSPNPPDNSENYVPMTEQN